MRKYKYKMGNGLTLFEEKDVKMCEVLASKGYKLVCVNVLGFYKFEYSEPEDVSFSVDYTDKSLKKEELEEYIRIFESGGWNYVCSVSRQGHYFKAKRGTVPIYTDDMTRLNKLEGIYKISVQCAIVGIVFMVVGLAISIFMPLVFGFYHAIFGAIVGSGAGLTSVMGMGIIRNGRRIAEIKKRNNFS